MRGCRIRSASRNEPALGGSACSIKAECLRGGHPVGRHAAETGQAFEEDALQEGWRLTLGQPRLANALAYQACCENRSGRDRPIALEAVGEARGQPILCQDTHLDRLAGSLRDSSSSS